MRLRCFAITVFMLTAISAVSAQDICQFLGEWRTDSIEGGKQWGIEFYITDDGELLCSTRLFDTNRITTANVVIFDGTLYAEFHLKDSVNSNFRCDTIKNYILLECTIENDSLNARMRLGNLVISPWGNEINYVGETTYILHIKRKSLACHEKKYNKSFAAIQDTSTLPYFYLKMADSLYRSDIIGIKRMSQLLFEAALESPITMCATLTVSDYNYIRGYSNYHLAQFDFSDSLKDYYYKKAIKYLPNSDNLFDIRTDAYLQSMHTLHDSMMFSRFAKCSDIINKYRAKGVVSETDAINLKNALCMQSDHYAVYLKDTVRCLDYLDSVQIANMKYMVMDSVFNSLLCQRYASIACAIDYANYKEHDTIDAFARGYYEKAMVYRKKAGIESVSKNQSVDMLVAVWAYMMMHRDYFGNTLPKWAENIIDSCADYLMDYSHNISYQQGGVACLALFSFMKRHKDIDFLTFYDSIKNNFIFDFDVKSLYLWNLAYWGYPEDEIMKCANQILSMKSGYATKDTTNTEQFRCLSAYGRMINGDFAGAYTDLIKYGKLSVDSLNIYRYTAMMSGERGYKEAFDICRSHDYAYVWWYYTGYYAIKCVQNYTDIDTAKFMTMARNVFRSVILEEKRIGIIDRTPFAYFWLGKEDSALYSMERMLVGADSLKARLYSAGLYCLLGKRQKAKDYLNQYLQLENTPFTRAWVRHDSHLDAIRDYADKLCETYEGIDSIWPKHIEFKDTTVTVPCHFGGWNDDYATCGGSIYIRCKLSDIDTTIIFDPGAHYVQITPNIACALISEGKLTPLENEKFKSANGGGSDQRMAILKSITLGGDTLRNVVVTVANDSTAPLLLGQNVLGVFSTVAIDYRNAQIHLTRTEEIIEENK